jgi:DNA-binding transcriptional LysR family regulator
MKATPLTQLQVFVTVARLLSFSAAARELGVTPSAVSQTVRQLETRLGVVLLARTTRSVSLTDGGRQLLEATGPALDQALAALTHVAARPGEVLGRLRLTVPRIAIPSVVAPAIAAMRQRHPGVEIEVSVDERFVDIVAEGYDAGVRLTEAIERDMVQVRLSDPFRFVAVASPAYLARRGTPERPEDLLGHDCITFRSQTTGTLYAWEFERGRRTWRVPVQGGVISSDHDVILSLAEQGLGLVYVPEPVVAQQLLDGRLQVVLGSHAPTVPGFFLYYPSRAQRSAALGLFLEAARDLHRREADRPNE